LFSVYFYANKQGKQPVKEYIQSLEEQSETNKDCRIRVRKIFEHIEILKLYGTRAGLPYVKHINNDLWELRPTSDRIIFFYWKDNKFILLHHFQKKTNKTPIKEINQAIRNMNDFLERYE